MMKSILFTLSILGSVLGFVPSNFKIQSAGNVAPLIVNEQADIIPGEYIVLFKEDQRVASGKSTDELIDEIMASIRAPEDSLMHRYNEGFAARLSSENVEMVRSREEVDLVEANQVVYAHDSQQNPPSWGLPRISQREFRNKDVYTFPDSAGENVDVYIIDTGINIEHEDFEGRAVWGYTAPAGDSDIDGNGHGTHVASTVAGKRFGVAKKATVIAVKVLRTSGYGSTADVVAGVEWAANAARKSNKRSTANMSLGGRRSIAMDRAVEKAVELGLQMAIAAGNSNGNACSHSPAAADPVVTVGATTIEDTRASFSNYGKCVDIFAPGHQITAAWIGSTTAEKTISGTSMASPHVAGVMALLLGEDDYTPAELKAKLIEMGTKDAINGRLPRRTINLLLNNQVSSKVSSSDEIWY